MKNSASRGTMRFRPSEMAMVALLTLGAVLAPAIIINVLASYQAAF